jgi:hypothetical protein
MQIPGALPDILKSLVGLRFTIGIFVCGTNPLGKDDLDVVTRNLRWSDSPSGIFIPALLSPEYCVPSQLRCGLLIAIPYAVVRRRDIEPWDWLMMAGSVMVIVVLAVPDTFFVSSN